MRLIHFSQSPLLKVSSEKQSDNPHHKPEGLWFSAGDGEDGWRSWCLIERFHTHRLGYRTELKFKRSARILRIKSASGIDRITRAYGVEPGWASTLPNRTARARRWRVIDVRWKEIAKQYDAIIIAPYIYQRRLAGPMWYYTWDVASGCVWNAGAIESLTPLWNSPLLD